MDDTPKGKDDMERLLKTIRNGSRDPDHRHCWHMYRGAILMVIPDGHVLQKCCECPATRTIHAEHMIDDRDHDGRKYSWRKPIPWRQHDDDHHGYPGRKPGRGPRLHAGV